MNYTNQYANQQFLYIAQTGKRLLGVIGGVDETTVQIEKKANNTYTLSFTAYETFNGEKSAWYDYLDELMEIYVDGIWFIIKNPPEINHDGKIENKSVEAQSYEIELQNYDIQRFKVGQGTESSYEMMFQSKYPKDKYPDKYKETFPRVKFYNPDEPELSLLHILLHHAGLIPSKIEIGEDGNEIDNWVDNIADSPWQIGKIDSVARYEDSSGQKLDTPVHLSEESYAFDIDNSDLYSVLTQDVSSAFSCIFTFDTINCKINATYVEHIGKDTNVYIGWRNIQNTLKATRSEELYTSITVSGGDGIDNIVLANFGETDLEDYSYLLEDERYVPTTLKEKYNAWKEYRDSKRLDYVNLQKKYADAQDRATEIKARVPVDGATEDWASKSTKDLMQAYDDYTAMIKGYESSYVDENGNFDLNALKKSADWDKYEQIMNYILPTIINELVKRNDEDKSEIQDSLKEYGSGNILKNATFITSSNWYGINNSLSECIDFEDNSPVYGATRYMTIHSSSESCGIKQKGIDTTKGSIYTLSAFICSSNVSKIQLGYSSSNDENDYSKVNYTQKSITSSWTRVQITFTAPSDITEIYFSCEGENSNFDITAPMLELGESASTFQYFQMDEEYQKSYLTDWKLYGVDELTICQKRYYDQMDVLKGFSQEYNEEITDKSEEVYNTYHQLYLDYKKLYDECTIALTERKKEYDDVISERDGYKKEYTEIASNVRRENFGKVQTKYEGFTKYEEYLLKKLYKHTDYQNENIITTTITSSTEKVEKEYQLYLDAADRLYAASHPQYTWEDTLDNVYGLEEFKDLVEPLDIYNFVHVEVKTDGTFERLRLVSITYNPCVYQGDFTLTFSTMTRYKSKRNDFNELLNSALSAAKNSLTLATGNSKDVTAYTITPEFIKSLLASSSFNAYMNKNNEGTVSGITGNFTNLYAKYIDADQVMAKLVQADKGEFKELIAGTIDADMITTKILNADKGFFTELTTQLIKDESGQIIIDLINHEINISTLNADVANIKTLLAGTGSVGDLQTIHLTASNVTIDEAVIKDLIASKISVADLMAHSATAELITLISQDGNPSIAFKDSTQQFYDKDGNVRVQIGQDGNGNFNFLVKGTDGRTAMFDENGITQEGIPSNTIINNMISDETISKSKLNFPIVETDENGNVSITHIIDGSGNSFGIKYVEFQESTNASIKRLNSKIDDSIPFEIRFVTPQGVNTSRKISQITISVNLFQNNENVTDKYKDSCFTWERSTYDSSSDKYWNEQHSSGAKTITINRSDVMFSAAYFTCTFSYDGETLAKASIRQSKSR